MNAWKIVCATLVIFIAGIVTGAVLMRLGERGPRPWLRPANPKPTTPMIQSPAVNPPGPGTTERQPLAGPSEGGGTRENRDREFVQQLDREVRLTSEQRQAIVTILADGQERIRQLRQGIEPDIRREMQNSREQIQALLTETQRAEFQRLMAQRPPRRSDATNPPAPERRLREIRDQRRPVFNRDAPQLEPAPAPPR